MLGDSMHAPMNGFRFSWLMSRTFDIKKHVIDCNPDLFRTLIGQIPFTKNLAIRTGLTDEESPLSHGIWLYSFIVAVLFITCLS